MDLIDLYWFSPVICKTMMTRYPILDRIMRNFYEDGDEEFGFERLESVTDFLSYALNDF